MISLRATQLLLLLASLVCFVPVALLIAHARHEDSWERRGPILGGAGVCGLASGGCLGASVAMGRSVAAVLAAIIVLGAIAGLAATAVVFQALWLFERQRRTADCGAPPDLDSTAEIG